MSFRRVVIFLLVTLLLAPPAAHAAGAEHASLELADDDALYKCKKYDDKTRIKVTLKPEVELGDLVAWAMGFSCKTFLYGSGVASQRSQKVTIIAPTVMAPKDAYRLFLTALASMNLTVVPRGKALEIVETHRAKESPLPLTTLPGGDPTMVRVLIRPKHIALAEVSALAGAMKSPQGGLLEIPGANAILVTDGGEFVSRFLEVLTEIDVPARPRLLRIPLTHADAADVVPTVTAALGSPSTKIVPDVRTNAVLVIGPERDFVAARELVAALDEPAGGSAPRARVIRLEHTTAEETAGVLTGVLAGGGGGGASGKNAAPVTGEVRVSFSKSTNSLIVVAGEEDFRAVREIVKALDVQRPQVYVEAIIVEMSMERARNIGVAVHGGDQTDWGTLVGSFSPGSLSSVVVDGDAEAVSSLFQGLAVGLFGPSFQFLGVTVPSLGALFQVVQTSGAVNVLSMPQIIATDHEKASISAGQDVPYLSQVASTGLSTGQSVQRQTLDLKLTIEPHIGAKGDVTLRLDLHVKELGKPDPDLGPTWSTRELQTVVTVRDGQPIVLGGLVSERESRSRSQIPILGDIPLIGPLFRSTETRIEKKNLIIVLVPTVLPDAMAARVFTEKKLRERAEFGAALAALDRPPTERPDYSKKRGLVAEIDHQVRKADEDADLRYAPR